jgi:KipI family sensor histidine kinase inhibitor
VPPPAEFASEPVRLRWASDRALLVEPPLAKATIDPDHPDDEATGAWMVAAWRRLRLAALAGVREVQPAYATLLVVVDPLAASPRAVERAVGAALAGVEGDDPRAAATIEIPTCYDPQVAPDLEAVAALHGLTPEEVARRHSAASYRVRFLGFAPGFAYLSGLPRELATPRLAEPRRQVPAGSVAIGGAQAAIYPLATPGGWRLVGRTPLRLFDRRRTPMALLAPGDGVRFVPIDRAELERLEGR